ncbi:hypothetical protein H0H92_002784 [Tricholoma furcatifolium]|nr:hypothetical protein H0H92_002784 [Tricholoma furcatifolium]
MNPLIFSVTVGAPKTRISLFPAFQRARTMDGVLSRILKPAIERNRGTCGPLSCNDVEELCLFFKTLEDTEFVHRYILEAAGCFTNIKTLKLAVQEMVPADMMTIIVALSHLEHLENITFHLSLGESKDVGQRPRDPEHDTMIAKRRLKEINLHLDHKTMIAYVERQFEGVPQT